MNTDRISGSFSCFCSLSEVTRTNQIRREQNQDRLRLQSLRVLLLLCPLSVGNAEEIAALLSSCCPASSSLPPSPLLLPLSSCLPTWLHQAPISCQTTPSYFGAYRACASMRLTFLPSPAPTPPSLHSSFALDLPLALLWPPDPWADCSAPCLLASSHHPLPGAFHQ
jgi:hypothetical protein